MIKNIAVLGTGGWGTALGLLLFDKGYNVKMWSPFEAEIQNIKESRTNVLLDGITLPDEIYFTSDIRNALTDAELILIAVPSNAVKSVCHQMSFLENLPVVVNVAKGFDPENDERLSEVIKNTLNTEKVVVLSGPTHAEEVARKLPTTIVASSENLSYASLVQDVFMCDYFRVYTNTDVIGAEICGALKNVIALCAGISDGSGFGDNAKAALMTRGMKEIKALGIKMGANQDTFSGLTGIGDLIVTCTSVHSRNRRAGYLIGQGKTPKEAIEEVKMVVEGVKACKSALNLAKKYNVDLPIINAANDVLLGKIKAYDAVKMLMIRDKKHE